MSATAVDIGLGILVVSVAMCLIRFAIGPTTADRVVAVDTIATNLLGITALFAIRSGEDLFILAILVFAILAFVGTAVYAKFLERGKIIE
ncbi:MAG: monovalent cation/H+ antiporter complex subunit F [bacterium]|nr:monovalent cation/H+ antiporter complex subunit F [bacterium]